MDENTLIRVEKIFPDYFDRFEMPAGAHEESIKVYRACRSRKCDAESFLPSYEENGFKTDPMLEENDPGQYSLSTFEKPAHVKRFAMVRPDFPVPYKIAVGNTNPVYGVVQRTKERTGGKSSHVDWWLYKDAKPYLEFELIEDFEEYLQNYRKEMV